MSGLLVYLASFNGGVNDTIVPPRNPTCQRNNIQAVDAYNEIYQAKLRIYQLSFIEVNGEFTILTLYLQCLYTTDIA